MFLGREEELTQLQRMDKLNKASLIICRGRRRIGKSTLIQHFGRRYQHFYEFQGLAPREQITNHDQLTNFSQQLAAQFDLPSLHFRNWHEAFSLLAKHTERGKHLVFLDEISWMASCDKDFVGQLKISWDTKFKKNNKLMLVLCGSVSSWIDKNILKSADFMGRISLSINLGELSLHQCNQFWGNRKKHTVAFEKFKLLSIVGGVPRYLEEINYTQTAEKNITELCFKNTGILFNEFDKIFDDIFSRKARIYRSIVLSLISGSKSFSEICVALSVDPNGMITEYLNDLESSSFIKRDYIYSLRNQQRKKLSKYRLQDNYLRFYLKYIEPLKEKITNKLYVSISVEDFLAFENIMGLQLENLVLNNLPLLFHYCI